LEMKKGKTQAAIRPTTIRIHGIEFSADGRLEDI